MIGQIGRYIFEVEIDGGAAFSETRCVTEDAVDYVTAEYNALLKLRREFKNKVALFIIKSYKRI